MGKDRILVVDDEDDIRSACDLILSALEYDVQLCSDGKSARQALQEQFYDLVLLDLRLPDLEGTDLLRNLVEEFGSELPVIMMSGNATIEAAIESLKLGAHDFLLKPFGARQLEAAVRKALEVTRLKRELRYLRAAADRPFADLIGDSDAIRHAVELAAKVAKSKSATVLLLGETGTGKGLFARAIHVNSSRVDRAFVAINCAAMPETLLEAELFGHEKGAFTDASGQKTGLVEVANGGTLFLDEIGEMAPNLQSKLLTVIEEKQFRRVGGTKNVQVDARIVAATNADIEKYVAEGRFRRDLYYRLNVFPIRIPPLRDRAEDALLLAKFFLQDFNKEFGKSLSGFTQEAEAKLLAYPWPGNVRELRNAIERAVLLGEDEFIEADDLALTAV